MAKCQICGKKSSTGRTSKHRRGVASRKFVHRAAKRSKTFRPNIQKTTLRVGGLKLTMRVCTRCLKKMKQGRTWADQKGLAKNKNLRVTEKSGKKKKLTPENIKKKTTVKKASGKRKKTEKK